LSSCMTVPAFSADHFRYPRQIACPFQGWAQRQRDEYLAVRATSSFD
jgi:hypothetical protein